MPILNDDGVVIFLGLLFLGGLILIPLVKKSFGKVEDAYGVKKAIQFTTGVSLLIVASFFFVARSCSGTGVGVGQSYTIDQYISENKFEEARQLASRSNNPSKDILAVLKAEFSYWVSKDQLDRCKSLVSEMKLLDTDIGTGLYEITRDIAVYESSLELMRAFCRNDQKKEGIEFANSFVNSFKEYLRDVEIFNRVQYNEIKGQLQEDEIIEPYHTIRDERNVRGVDEQYHKIYRVYRPRLDALKIIKECK